MKIKNQIELLNMVNTNGTYQKNIDGYRIQFSVEKKQLFKKTNACLRIVTHRKIEDRERRYIIDKVVLNHSSLWFEREKYNNDTICLASKINNKTIDLVMQNIFWVIQACQELEIKPQSI